MPLTRKEINRKYNASPKGIRARKLRAKLKKMELLEYHKQWVKKNKEKSAFYVNRWRKNNPKKFTAQILKYARKNKEKIRAYRKFRRALREGLLHRPLICEQCGKEGRIDAHHHNGYDHPLDVLWLCRQCHVDKHPNPKKKS